MSSVIYNRELFGPLFYHLRKYSKDPKVRRILVPGGSSAGKSHTFCQEITIDGAFEGGFSTAVFRKEQSVVKDTIKPEFEDVMGRVMDNDHIRDIWEKQDFQYIAKDGNRIRFKGIDKSDKAKGLKGFKKIYCDELDQFTKADYKELGRRLRGEDNQQLWASWNPVPENHWLTKEIERDDWIDMPLEVEGHEGWSKLHDTSYVKMSPDGRTVVIKTTYLDNKWVVGGEVDGRKYGRVDEQVIAEFEDMKINDPEDYRVYGLGEPGRLINDRPFFKRLRKNCFSRFGLFEGYNLYLTFDFNIDECAATALQLIEDEGIYIHKSWGVSGGLEALCKEIKEDIDLDQFHVIVTGDASGKSGSAYSGIDPKTGQKYNMYTMISNELDIPFTKRHFKINNANKAHYMSFSLCNSALSSIPVIFHKDHAFDLWQEMYNAKLVDRFDKVELLKNQENMNNRVDTIRYGLDILFPNQIGKEGKRGSVKYLEALIRENRPEMIEWYQSLAKAHSVQAA